MSEHTTEVVGYVVMEHQNHGDRYVREEVFHSREDAEQGCPPDSEWATYTVCALHYVGPSLSDTAVREAP